MAGGGKRVSLTKGAGESEAPDLDPVAANEHLAQLMMKPSTPGVTPEEKELRDSVDHTIHPKRFSVMAIVVALVVVGASVIGGFWIKGDERLKENWFLFWEGRLADEYKQRAQAEFDRNEKVDRWTINRYGDITLFYSPRDSRVKVTQLAYSETQDQFVKRYIRGGDDERKTVGEKELEAVGKKTASLKETEYFQNLPIKFLPLVERQDDNSMQTFEYRVEITHVNKSGKPDYKSRTYLVHTPFSYHAPAEGVTPLRFQDAGGGSFRAPFHGADLVPEPSVFMCNYAEVTYKTRCDLERRLKVDPDDKLKVIPTEAEIPALKEALLMDYSGLPTDEWQERVAELTNYTADPEAWAHAQEMAANCLCEYKVLKPDPNDPNKDDPTKAKPMEVPYYPSIRECPLYYKQLPAKDGGNEENYSRTDGKLPDGITPIPPEQDKAYCRDWRPLETDRPQ